MKKRKFMHNHDNKGRAKTNDKKGQLIKFFLTKLYKYKKYHYGSYHNNKKIPIIFTALDFLRYAINPSKYVKRRYGKKALKLLSK